MASTWNSLRRMIGIAIPASMAVLAIGSGPAWAQVTVSGSDTMTQVIQDAITASGAHIQYINVGSGQGEKNIANLSGESILQSIAPMSRNFTSSVLSISGVAAPTPDNVLCLDAGIVAVGNIPPHITDLTCSSTPGNNACDQTCNIQTNVLAIALGGYPASCRASGTWSPSTATTAECADPQRIAALSLLNAKQGFHIDHFMRRDDKSGTQDTFRERLQFSRWCNGKSEGNTNAVGSNLQNWDLDPVRKPCLNKGGAVQDTRCTYYPLNYPPVGQTCQNGQSLAANDPNNPYGVAIPCTQGWVVALSETDTGAGMPDITTSIGSRINTALDGSIMGGAGLAVLGNPGDPIPTPPIAAVTLPNTVGITLNTQGFDVDTVRGGHYAMWRRLFLQNRNPPDLVNDPTGAIRQANCVAWTHDATRCTEEQKLYDWASNRQNMCDICVFSGFYDPIPGCHVKISGCSDPLNETCLSAEAGLGTPKMNTGAEAPGAAQHGAACDTAYPCVANGQVAPSSGGNCGGTEAGKCPVIPTLGVGFACNFTAAGTLDKCSGGSATCNTSAIIEVCQ